MLRNRAARPGESDLSGDRWWPTEAWKYADLYEEGAVLTSYERWLAEREVERRLRRRQMPSVVRRESLTFERTRIPGVFVAYVVAPHPNLEASSHTVELLHLQPSARTLPVREYESVLHVLSGSGFSMIHGERYDWGIHDSIHVPEGAWHQHVNAGATPVNLIVGRATPLMEQVYPMARVYKGDSYSDLPDDFKPEHPFTKERVAVGYVEGMKWMSQLQMSEHHERGHHAESGRKNRKVMKASEAVIERSEHKGDWKVGLIDRHVGFENRILAMYVHQLPPECHTETHKHGWATVFVLSGQGYSIVDGERFDWQMGDMLNVPAGGWHQHFNTSLRETSQHLLIGAQGFRQRILLSNGAVEERTGDSPSLDLAYKPSNEWWKLGS
jgi:quercetin dioxygenase-like cupin family protein